MENQATEQQHFNLVWNGMDEGKLYFSRKQGNPQMRASGINRNTGKEAEVRSPTSASRACSPPKRCGRSSPTSGTPLQRLDGQELSAGTIESPTFVNVPRDTAGSN